MIDKSYIGSGALRGKMLLVCTNIGKNKIEAYFLSG